MQNAKSSKVFQITEDVKSRMEGYDILKIIDQNDAQIFPETYKDCGNQTSHKANHPVVAINFCVVK